MLVSTTRVYDWFQPHHQRGPGLPKNHWRKTVSSTADHKTRDAVLKKLARREKSAAPSTPTPASTPTPTSTPPSASSQESNDEFRPKRACSTTPRPAGTQVIIPRDVLKKVGPAADRLGLSHQQATAFLSSIINNSGGNLEEIAVSTSTARISRATARAEGATSIKDSYTFLIGQINFDGKLLGDLDGSFDKVNRLAVVAVQEEGNQLLCIDKTDDSTGKVEAATVKEALDDWGISDGIIASCFDTTSSNTGIYSSSTVLLQQHLNRQLLWLSCRHHIPELILKAVFQTLFGKTTGPCLKTSWKSLDLTDLRLPPTPSFPHSQMPASQPASLCNPALETETCNQLAREIGGLPPTSIQIRKPTLPSITSSSTLPDFVGSRSVLLFSQLKLDHTFLLAEDWRETLHFSTLKSAISNLHPVNDSSERALALATSFNGRITRDEESYQDMMLVVAAHRKKYGFKTKKDLKNFV